MIITMYRISVSILTSASILEYFLFSVATPIGTAKETDNINFTSVQKSCSAIKYSNNYSICCSVHSGDIFYFANFRNWSKHKNNNTNIRLKIVCHNGGRVVLPWPYRSYYLVSLVIEGCVLEGYNLERNRTEFLKSIQDRLEWIELVNCDQYTSLADLETSFKYVADVSKEFECGPLTVFRYAKRNLTSSYELRVKNLTLEYYDLPDYGAPFVFENDENTSSKYEEYEYIRQDVVRASESMKHVCYYSNWKYYENSYNLDIGKFHLKGLTDNSNLPQLGVINFTHTYQYSVPNELHNWRLHFPKLEILDMTYCLVSEFNFHDYSIDALDKGYIDLQFNNISSLTENEISSFKRLKSTVIDIRNNPFHCACHSMSDFVEFLHRHKNAEKSSLLDDYAYLWELRCTSPSQFTDRRISELTKDILCNIDRTIYIAQIAVLSIVVMILIIIIIVSTRYRREIRILVFTRLHIILPCESAEEPTRTYQYDAFLSYSSNDADWVINTLVKGLEDPQSNMGLRLCLHHRDFNVGEYICDNIISSVENSRHTVLIVSQNFLLSEWCVFEFREALCKSLLEKRSHMVIVLLEDVELTNVESDFRRCLQTMTYIKADDPLFWDRMKYALGRKSKNISPVFDNKLLFENEKSISNDIISNAPTGFNEI